MRIGLNLLYMLPGVVCGTETYAAGLLAGFAKIDRDDEFVVFVNREAKNWPLPPALNFVRVVCPVSAVSRARRYFFEQVRLPGLLKKHRIDIVHSLGYTSPLFCPCPSVVTVPDLNFRAFGDRMPLVRRLVLEYFVKKSADRASHVITISEFARGQILSMLGIKSDKITVTLLAPLYAAAELIKMPEILRKYGIKQPYIIAFNSANLHKNIPRLIQAFTQARQDYNLLHQLVLLGHSPANKATNLETEKVVSTGYVDEHSRNVLLKGAEMLIFPSTYEGFGLPVLEAQQAGVPVVCSTAASLPEVAGDAAIYFDPLSVNEMSKAIGQVAQNSDLRQMLKQKGFKNAVKFSWEQTALQTLQVYRKLVNQ